MLLCPIRFVADLKALFRRRALYSEAGSTEREKEEATYMLFCDYLDECEGTAI